MKKFISLFLILIFLTGCNSSIFDSNLDISYYDTALEISKLDKFDTNKITFTQTELNKFNFMIDLINEKFDFKIQNIVRWSKIGLELNRVLPILDDYNNLIDSSKNLIKNENLKTQNNFKKSLVAFSLGILINGSNIFYGPSFKIVGSLTKMFHYKVLAFSPTITKSLMSTGYWTTNHQISDLTKNQIISISEKLENFNYINTKDDIIETFDNNYISVKNRHNSINYPENLSQVQINLNKFYNNE
jgi:hypothetical protein